MIQYKHNPQDCVFNEIAASLSPHLNFTVPKSDFHALCLLDVQGCQDGKLQAERIATLQERKQALEALLNARVGELKQVCLQEAVSRSRFIFETQLSLDSLSVHLKR